MARPVVQHGSSRLALGFVVVALLLSTLLPPGALRWTGWLAQLVERLVIPVQAPVEAVMRRITARRSGDESDSPALDEARDQAELFRTLYRQAQEDVARLRNTIDDLTAGRVIQPGMGVVQIPAPVIGSSGGTGSKILKVRAGSDLGVAAGDVVTFRGIHIVGRVMSQVDAKFCWVQALTDRASGGANLEGRGRITGHVFLDGADPRRPVDPSAQRVTCLLAPTSDGRLSGDAQYVVPTADRAAPAIPIGSVVRLVDDRWPATAQMLVLGRVVRVDPKPNQRLVVTVEPQYDLAALREVIVRVMGDPNEREGAGTGGPSGGGTP
ncbi:MAG: hypothetical protein AB7K52_15055 [Phycisphaerales bacterium]